MERIHQGGWATTTGKILDRNSSENQGHLGPEKIQRPLSFRELTAENFQWKKKHSYQVGSFIKLLFVGSRLVFFSIPRPKLKRSTEIDPYHGSQSSHGYGRRVSGSDSGVYSSVSGYSSTEKILRNLNHHQHISPPRSDKEKSSWRNLILRESVTEADLCSQFTRMYQRNRNYKRKKNKVKCHH